MRCDIVEFRSEGKYIERIRIITQRRNREAGNEWQEMRRKSPSS